MKKLFVLLMALVSVLSVNIQAADTREISGGGGFAIVDRCYEDQEEDFLLYYHSGCSQSQKMLPVVKNYAEKNDINLFIVDYRKGKFPGMSVYVGSTVINFPVVLAYNNDTKVLAGLNGIESERHFKNFAEEILSLENPEIKLTIDSKEMICNGKTVELDVPATIVDGRTLVPLRAIMEAYGMDVNWDDENKMATSDRYGTKIEIYMAGSFYIGKKYFRMNALPQIIEGRIMVPVRTITEAFGAEVTWDETTRTVTLN